MAGDLWMGIDISDFGASQGRTPGGGRGGVLVYVFLYACAYVRSLESHIWISDFRSIRMWGLGWGGQRWSWDLLGFVTSGVWVG